MRIGSLAYLNYGWESTYGDGASTRNKAFGRGVRITGIAERHNLQPVVEFGDRVYATWLFKMFEGLITLEFLMSNPWWFRGLMGSVTTSGSTPPYTHTFTRNTTTHSVPSMGLEFGFKGETGDVVRLLKGGMINSMTLSTAINEPVLVRVEVYYGSYGTASISSQATDSFEPYTCVHTTLEIPSGTKLAEVQNLELTVNNNVYRLYELGSEYQIGSVPQIFEVSGRMTLSLKDASLLGWLRGTQTNAAIKLVKSNNENITINLSNVAFEEFSLPVMPAEPVFLELPFRAKDITSIVAKNSVSSAP